MPLRFTNVVKAQVTQSLVSTLLEHAGYRVTRLGIEELFGEIKHLDLDSYMGLRLPVRLRYLPDLLVADLALSVAYLVEVKFRSRFDDRSVTQLHQELSEQRQHWPESYAVIMISESFVPDGHFHQDYIRVLRPGQTEILVKKDLSPQERWEALPQIYHVFRNFDEVSFLYDADSTTPILKDLAKLQDHPMALLPGMKRTLSAPTLPPPPPRPPQVKR